MYNYNFSSDNSKNIGEWRISQTNYRMIIASYIKEKTRFAKLLIMPPNWVAP